MKEGVKPPTDEEIREEVYSNTFQETGDEIEAFIRGMIYMRDKWLESNYVPWIYERDGNKIYRRPFGSNPSARELINTLKNEDITDGD
jgi:hypothetical protein